MKEILQKRPFSRPLFFWVVGCFLQMAWPDIPWGFGLALLACVWLLFSGIMVGDDTVSYAGRGSWGLLFSLLLMALAAFVTASSARVPPREMPFRSQAVELRDHLLTRIEQLELTEEEKSVLSALTLGYRQRMSRETRKHFAVSGVSHVLAVSGFHVGVVCGFLAFATRRFYRWRIARCLLQILLLVGYVWLTGLSVSAMRAGLMLSLYLIGRAMLREVDPFNIWAASAFCMLVCNPYNLLDIGFQLSYVAVFFILLFHRRLSRLLKIYNPLVGYCWELLVLTCVAQVGTAGLCLYHFGYVSWLFLLTNIPVALFAWLLIPLGLLWVVWPFPEESVGLQRVVEWLTHGLVEWVTRFSQMPGTDWECPFGVGLLAIYYLGLLGGWFLLRKRESLFQ